MRRFLSDRRLVLIVLGAVVVLSAGARGVFTQTQTSASATEEAPLQTPSVEAGGRRLG